MICLLHDLFASWLIAFHARICALTAFESVFLADLFSGAKKESGGFILLESAVLPPFSAFSLCFLPAGPSCLSGLRPGADQFNGFLAAEMFDIHLQQAKRLPLADNFSIALAFALVWGVF